MTDQAYGLWAGLSVDNTAEATAAGALRSETSKNIAVLTKTTRNAMIGFVVLGAAIYFASRGGHQLQGSKAMFVWRAFPKFVLGFLLFSAAASLTGSWALFNPAQVKSLENLSRWAFLLTFAGVGSAHQFPRTGPSRLAAVHRRCARRSVYRRAHARPRHGRRHMVRPDVHRLSGPPPECHGGRSLQPRKTVGNALRGVPCPTADHVPRVCPNHSMCRRGQNTKPRSTHSGSSHSARAANSWASIPCGISSTRRRSTSGNSSR